MVPDLLAVTSHEPRHAGVNPLHVETHLIGNGWARGGGGEGDSLGLGDWIVKLVGGQNGVSAEGSGVRSDVLVQGEDRCFCVMWKQPHDTPRRTPNHPLNSSWTSK